MANKKIQQIEEHVRKIMGNEVAHGFSHVDRVRKWALQIAKKENYKDLEMVETAALMHDIGKPGIKNERMHGEVGAVMAEKFLKENCLFTDKKIEEICNAIRHHNKNRGGEGELLKILRDADMLDLFGAVGLMRALTVSAFKPEFDPLIVKGKTWKMTNTEFNKRFDEGVGVGEFIVDQINFNISCYENLNFNTTRLVAKPLVEYMKNYLKQLEQEVKSSKK